MTASVKLGLLRLTDSAPAILAAADHLFSAEGVQVELTIEPSWANLADKLAWGGLDAAIMLAPLAIAVSSGLRGARLPIRVPMGISRGGNSIVARTADTAEGFADWVRSQKTPPRFAVVHVFSSHALLLRDWLGRSGIDAATALDIVVVPPENIVEELAAGRIAGFSAGAPWGDHAQSLGAGRILLGSSAIRPNHLEKCLAVTEALAARQPAALQAMMRAQLRAQALCDDPARAGRLAQHLADELGLPEEAAAAALPGGPGAETISFAGAAVIEDTDWDWVSDAMAAQGWLSRDEARIAI